MYDYRAQPVRKYMLKHIFSKNKVRFVDPRFSTAGIIQCIGRALRLHPAKKLAYIVIPVFIENLDDKLNKNIYSDIINILNLNIQIMQ